MEIAELSLLILVSLVVGAGTVLQVATGVGLGLLAGPVLILSMQSDTAVFVAIVLNLLVSLVLLPAEWADISWPPLRRIMAGAVVGVPLGWLVLQQIDTTSLKLLAGTVVLAAAIQQLFPGRRLGGAAAGSRTLVGGAISGFMTASLAIPGPIAMWALLQHDITPSQVRATLRGTFVFAYSAAFLVHFGLAGGAATGWGSVAVLLPALAVGLGLGIIAKAHVADTVLSGALKILLLVMGVSLLWKGISDAVS